MALVVTALWELIIAGEPEVIRQVNNEYRYLKGYIKSMQTYVSEVPHFP